MMLRKTCAITCVNLKSLKDKTAGILLRYESAGELSKGVVRLSAFMSSTTVNRQRKGRAVKLK